MTTRSTCVGQKKTAAQCTVYLCQLLGLFARFTLGNNPLSDITGLSCKQTVRQSQLGILGNWAIFSSRIERVLLEQ